MDIDFRISGSLFESTIEDWTKGVGILGSIKDT